MFCHLKKMKFQLPLTVLRYYCNFKNQLQIIFTFELLPHLIRAFAPSKGQKS